MWEVKGFVCLSPTITHSYPSIGLKEEVQWFYVSAEALSGRSLYSSWFSHLAQKGDQWVSALLGVI